MLNNGNKQNCGFTDEIVSYIYGEIGSRDRMRFERHLAACPVCTDEFAAISNARFSVFEWQKEEFADLPTPQIVIPYGSTSNAGVAGESFGTLSAIRAWLSSLSLPTAVAAALLVCVGLTVLGVKFLGSRDQPIATIGTVPMSPTDTDTAVTSAPDPEHAETTERKESVKPAQPVKAAVTQSRRSLPHASPAVDRPSNNFAVAPKQTPQTPKAPVLNSYEDNDDSSLRLADLFDEVGG